MPPALIAQDDEAGSHVAKIAKWGTYVTNIYDANLSENSFKIDVFSYVRAT